MSKAAIVPLLRLAGALACDVIHDEPWGPRASERPLAFADAERPGTRITNAKLDGDAHPFVGSIVIDIPEEGLVQVCSGTLIAEHVFLTASHCTAALPDILNEHPGAEVLITFDRTIREAGEFFTGTPITNPAFTDFQGGPSDPGDIAVIILHESPGIEPAGLPTAGLLDELRAENVLEDTRFTAVGYGAARNDNHGGWQGIVDDLRRNQVEQGFRSLTGAWLNLSINLSEGDGGTCSGDSGGPHLIHLGDDDIVVSLTVTGDSQCEALDRSYRTDTPAAREFLKNYVVLP